MSVTTKQAAEAMKAIRDFYHNLNLRYPTRGRMGKFDREKVKYPKLDSKDPSVWFERTKDHALQNNQQLALWTFCVGTCLLFGQEIRNKKERLNIIDQMVSQLPAYIRKD